MSISTFLKQIKHSLEAEQNILLAYTEKKLTARDYHAVQDAASDLRDIEAKLELLRAIEDFCIPPQL